MGLFNLFKKKQIERTPAINFIDVEIDLKVVFPDKMKDRAKEELKYATQIMDVFYNTNAIFNKNGEFLGATNPILNQNLVFTNNQEKEMIARKPLKHFNINFNDKDSIFELTPKEKYSIKDLYSDFFFLFNASRFIEQYTNHPDFNMATFNVSFIKGKPAITHYDRLVSWTYLVEDRIEYQKGWEDFAQIIFPMTIEQILEVVRKNKKITREQSEKDKKMSVEWTIAVEKLLDKDDARSKNK